jgi:DNA-directed DNA polymerase III PolC
VHLHTHSYFSWLRGVVPPAALVARAAEEGVRALALTDWHSLSGALEFYDACAAAHIKPVIGLELTVAGAPLVLLAQTREGWRNLCRLLTQTGEGSASLEALAAHRTGLLCLTGGVRGRAHQHARAGDARALSDWLDALHHLFADRLVVQLARHAPDDAAATHLLARAATSLGVLSAATHFCSYLTPEQADLQRTITAIRLNVPRSALSDDALAPDDSHWLRVSELAARFHDLPTALAGAEVVADMCTLDLPADEHYFPDLSLVNPDSTLRERAFAGAARQYPAVTDAVRDRLEHELHVIADKGYAPIFLAVEEVLDFARATGVPTSSRGSASSSLVAHCLGITTPDPLALNLYFERFLNPARATPPDIDTDLCSRRRDSVIAHVFERFGRERVAMVATINRLQDRSALRETAKAYGLDKAVVDELLDALPSRWWGPRRHSPKAGPYASLQTTFRDPTIQRALHDAEALIGTPDHLSIHPGGVVIAPAPIVDFCPTTVASKGVTITTFDLDGVERLGLIKIDLLGIRGLTVMGDVAEAVSKVEAGEVTTSPASTLTVLDGIRPDDTATAELVRAARTIGVFQIESPGMRATLREINADDPDDILVALALYRPGPIQGGLKDTFVRRFLKQEPVRHLHPSLAPILDETLGVVLYQEQVLRIAHELAGLSLADADLLRRAMSHFDPGRQMKTLQERFVEQACARTGMPAAVAERVWGLMAAFAGYGFPKAHAAAYAQAAWRAAWCKAHHPALFMAAVLANWGGYYSQRIYLTEARRMGLGLRPPDVNLARREFSAAWIDGEPVLVMGLDQVRDLTQRTIERIRREQPFHSLADFLARADPRPVEAENLARVGALAAFGATPAVLAEVTGGGWRPGQMSLFDAPLASSDDWPLAERIAAQEVLLGAAVSAHPLEVRAQSIAATGALTTVEAAARLGQTVAVAGMRQTWRRTRTESDYLYFMDFEDLDGVLAVLLPGDVYRRHRALFDTGPGPFVIEGELTLDEETGEPLLRAKKVSAVS